MPITSPSASACSCDRDAVDGRAVQRIRGRRPRSRARRGAPRRGGGTPAGRRAAIAQSGSRPIRTASSPSWTRRPSGEHEGAGGAGRAGDDRGVDREVADAARGSTSRRDLDRPDEVVVRLAARARARCRPARRRATSRKPSKRSRSTSETRTVKSFGATVPRTPSVRPTSISRTRRRPISTGCRPLRNALPKPPSTSRSSLRSNRWSPIGAAIVPAACWASLARSRASGGIGRRAGFRFLCPQGRGGSSPPSRTLSDVRRAVECRRRGLRVPSLRCTARRAMRAVHDRATVDRRRVRCGDTVGHAIARQHAGGAAGAPATTATVALVGSGPDSTTGVELRRCRRPAAAGSRPGSPVRAPCGCACRPRRPVRAAP